MPIKIVRSKKLKDKDFTVGYDNSGNMFMKHNPCGQVMANTDIDFGKKKKGKKTYTFQCPACNVVKKIW